MSQLRARPGSVVECSVLGQSCLRKALPWPGTRSCSRCCRPHYHPSRVVARGTSLPLQCHFFFVPMAVPAPLSDSAAPGPHGVGIKTKSSVGLLSPACLGIRHHFLREFAASNLAPCTHACRVLSHGGVTALRGRATLHLT